MRAGQGRFAVAVDWALCWLEKGVADTAMRIFRSMDVQARNPSDRTGVACARAWVLVHPARKEPPDVAAALEILRGAGPMKTKTHLYEIYFRAGVLAAAGRHEEAYAVFQRRPGGWDNVPAIGFFMGRTARILGHTEQARRLFRTAMRLRPQYAGRFSDPEDQRLIHGASLAAQEFRKGSIEQNVRTRRELESQTLHVGHIRSFESAYRFEEAARAYRKYAGEVQSDSIKKQARRAAARSPGSSGGSSRRQPEGS